MSTDTDPLAAPHVPEPGRRPRVLPWVVGFAVVLAAAIAGFTLLDTEDDPSTAPTGSGGTTTQLSMTSVQGRCMAPDAVTLAQAQVAFEGSVVSVDNGVVTLDPATWYAGDHVDHVTVQEGEAGATGTVGAIDFRPGEYYFVAANQGQVMVCGFSGEKSSALESLYQEAFSGAAS